MLSCLSASSVTQVVTEIVNIECQLLRYSVVGLEYIPERITTDQLTACL